MHSDFIRRRRLPLAVSLCALLATASCNKDGDYGPNDASDFTVGFASANSTATEDGTEHTVTLVVNRVGDRETTPVPIAVSIADAGDGSAMTGEDFEALASGSFLIAEGAVDGDTATYTFTVLGDTLVEGTETVNLEITGVGGGASIADEGEHTVRIKDANEATVSFSSQSSSSPDEGDADYTLTVTLDYDVADTLLLEGVITIADNEDGTATSGSDYSAFESTTITFPTTSAPGDSRQVTLSIMDDDSAEADETIELDMISGTSGYAVSTATHVFTIVDDEVGVGPNLRATLDPDGTPQVLGSGSFVDFGSLATGATSTVQVLRLANPGDDNLTFSTPELSGDDARDFAITLDTSTAGFTAPGPPLPSPLVKADEDRHGVQLVLDTERLAQLNILHNATLVGLPLPGGGTIDLELERLPSPWGAHAKLFIDGAEQTQGVGPHIKDLSLWKGRVRDLEESSLFLALSPSGSHGWVRFGPRPEDELVLETTSDGTQLALWRSQLPEVGPLGPEDLCSTALRKPGAAFKDLAGPGFAPDLGSLVTASNCRLAIETDFQFFELFGDEDDATAYVTSLVAAISQQYLEDVQTTFSIEYLAVYTTAGDPWDAQDGAADSLDVLDEFQAAWSPDLGGEWPAEADLAHFLSGATLGGGVAYIDTLCDQDFGFGVSGDIEGNIDWDAFDGSSAGFNWDFVVMAHELGHNFNAEHTHDYCPPVDSCQATCEGGASCSEGTLMSYCHLCVGGIENMQLHFHPFIANEMRNAVRASCLGDALMSPGDFVEYALTFKPESGSGAKSATLGIVHDGSPAPSPFELVLTGTVD